MTVANGKVNPAPKRYDVPLGSTVRLTVNSDVVDEVHLHGYDVEETVRPGNPAVITFKADQPGLFEVETHESKRTLFQLQVS
ncbi:MAG: hypothetical protein EPO13_04915 [Actinomycetota bacterium]|nr:MAG: hypothetical protein EPO13_04915 [Actinomycetota bacterium]